MVIEAAIFDLNGTMINDGTYHDRAWRAYADKLGFKVSPEEFKNNMWGKNNQAILTYLFKKALPKELIEKYAEEKEAFYREIYKNDLKEVPGLTDLLKHLKNKGIKTAVATSAPTKNIDFALDRLDLRKYFNAIVDDSQITHSKPHPEIFLKAAEKLGVKPENCLVFEDSLFGFQSAREAGMQIIGLETSFSKEEIVKLGATQAIGSFEEISDDILEAA